MDTTIPHFISFADDTEERLLALAAAWKASPQRPRVDAAILVHWDGLIRQWIRNPSMPLPVKKKGNRGSVVIHGSTGRPLLCVDNAPANWVLSSALLGRCPAMDDVRQALESGDLPIAMILPPKEREVATYRGSLARMKDPPDLNSLKWKVCHIRPVGLKNQQEACRLPIADLEEHALRLLNPANMFLVPLSYGGLGEFSEFLQTFRDHEGRD